MARVCCYSCSHAKYGQIMFEAVYSLVEMLMTDIEREVNFFLSYDIIHAHPIFLASIPSLRLLWFTSSSSPLMMCCHWKLISNRYFLFITNCCCSRFLIWAVKYFLSNRSPDSRGYRLVPTDGREKKQDWKALALNNLSWKSERKTCACAWRFQWSLNFCLCFRC